MKLSWWGLPLFVLSCGGDEHASNAFAESPPVRAQQAAPLAAGFAALSSPTHQKSLRAMWPSGDQLIIAGEDGTLAKSDGKTLQHLTPSLEKALPERLLGIANKEDVIVIVGEDGRLLRSLDNGNTWKPSWMPLRETMRAALFTKDGTLWVAGDNTRAFYSKDNGETWTISWLPKPLTVNRIFETQSGGLYMACPRGTLFYSSDQKTWSELSLPKTPQVFFDVWTAPSGAIYISGSDGYIAKSTDGREWKRVKLESRADLLSIYAKSEDELYVAGEKGTILFSANQGRSWERKKTNTATNFTKIIAAPNGSLVALGYNGEIFSSVDGNTWEKTQSPTRQPIHNATATKEGAFAIGGEGLILKLSKGAWSPLTSTDAPTFHSVWSSDARSYAAGEDGALYTSIDQKTFSRMNVALGNGPLTSVYHHESALYVASGGKVAVSLDEGKTFTQKRLQDCERVEQLMGAGASVIARCTNTIFASNDQGAAWSKREVPGSFGVGASHQNKIVLAGVGESFSSQDAGASWVKHPSPTKEEIVSIWVSTETKIFVATEKTVHQSDDGGATWKTLGLSAPHPIKAISVNQGRLFISGDQGMLIVKEL
jgi:photosystem II stability/assembly factor-like uncharacterized protein